MSLFLGKAEWEGGLDADAMRQELVTGVALALGGESRCC
jgi:hypothetical protein